MRTSRSILLLFCLLSSCRSQTDSAPVPMIASALPAVPSFAATVSPAASALRSETDSAKLPVPGFAEAVLSLPLGSKNRRALIVALHSEKESAAQACEAARIIDDGMSFVLCPSGAKADTINTEVVTAIDSLLNAYPERINSQNISIIAWGSQGKSATSIATSKPEQFPRILLIDPSGAYLPDGFGHEYHQKGGQRLFVVCTTASCDTIAGKKLKSAQEHGLDTRHLLIVKADENAVVDALLPQWAWFKQGASTEAPPHEHSCPADLHP